MLTMTEHAQQIVEAHTLDENGWCRCGFVPLAARAEHAAHISRMLEALRRNRAEGIARNTPLPALWRGGVQMTDELQAACIEYGRACALAAMDAD